MGLLDELQKEIERAGSAARGALDEGRLRLDLYRVRRLADAAAAALGYAMHRARKDGTTLDDETITRLDATLTEQTAEVARIEAELERHRDAAAPTEKAAEAPESQASTETPPAAKP
jgi:hypothetical protein